MVIEVPDAVKHETNGCPCDFACLATARCGDPEKCKVDYANGKNVLVLASNEPVSCPYRISFGYRQICTCPNHIEVNSRGVILSGDHREEAYRYTAKA